MVPVVAARVVALQVQALDPDLVAPALQGSGARLDALDGRSARNERYL